LTKIKDKLEVPPKLEEENFSHRPSGWTQATVSDVGDVVTGKTPSKSNPNYYGKDYSFFKPTDLNAGFYVKSSRDGLSKEGIKKVKLVPEKSILVTCIGATIGKTGFIRTQGASNQQINAIVTRQGLLPEFFYFMCISPQFQKSIISNSSSTTLPIINKTRFERLLLPIPPFPEQRRIVNKLEELFTRLDAGVESLRRIKAQLRRYRQAVLKHAFKGKLTEEWRKSHKDEIEPASMLPKHIKEDREKTTKGKYIELPRIDTSDLPELPESWVWTRLEDIILLSTERFNPIISENERFVGLKNIESNTGRLLGFGKSSETRSAKTRFRTGDLLYGRLRPYLNKVWVADFEGVCSTDILVFLKNDFVDNNYLSMVLLNSDFVKYTIQRMTGVQHPRISFRSLSKYVVPLPSLHEQHVIAEEIKRNFSVSDKVERVAEQSLIQSERLRQGILKRAFEGRLVPQDPTDEPAEKLLKRIREWREKRNAEEKKIKLGKTSKQEQLGVSHYVK